MKNLLICMLLSSLSIKSFSQAGNITGKIGGESQNLDRTEVSLLKAKDSSLIKINLADKTGGFSFDDIAQGDYLVEVFAIGYQKIFTAVFTLDKGDTKKLPEIFLKKDEKKLDAVTVVTKKPLIERKADKVVFNVENSINATGSSALELLQKSPGVLVDNNDNISMKGKNGINIYIDGRMSHLEAQDLAAYLKSLKSDDIEAIEMISNPGAKYDASGNAGIINIRLKKNKKYGTNGNTNLELTQGITPKISGGLGLNYRDKKINIFSNVSASAGEREGHLGLYRIQNDSIYDQHTVMTHRDHGMNVKVGADLFKDGKNTFGVLVNSDFDEGSFAAAGNTNIYAQQTGMFVKKLVASNDQPNPRTNANFNVNYRYADTSGKEISFDADYGLFRSRGSSYQPNNYFDLSGNTLYSTTTGNSTPVDINIYTAKLDAEQKFLKGKIGYGGKVSYVRTNNSLDFYNYQNQVAVKSLPQSNSFVYTENVNAAYLNYNREFSSKWNLQAGLRGEQTSSLGKLTRADGIVQADNRVARNYFDLFPSGALNYNLNSKNSFGITYSRRIDRPGYQDLNPFENKLDELTYEKGNAFLRPQYTNSVELSHTYNSKITTSLGYSYVKDYATEIIDTTNGNATFVQRQNIATQQIISFNLSSPLSFTKWWTGYGNLWANEQVVNGAFNAIKVNLKSPAYGMYMENSFNLGKNYKAELSGWFNGPGIEGTWKRRAMGGVDAGLQKQVMKSKGTLRLSVNDVFNSIYFHAVSNYGNTELHINQYNENQTLRLAFSYRFGSNEIKAARQRKTGLESENRRIK